MGKRTRKINVRGSRLMQPRTAPQVARLYGRAAVGLDEAEATASQTRRRKACARALLDLQEASYEAGIFYGGPYGGDAGKEDTARAGNLLTKRFMNVCSFAARIPAPTLKGVGRSTYKFGRNKRTGECLKRRRKKR